ncbi:MAG: peptidase T [Bacteroidales bacterium]
MKNIVDRFIKYAMIDTESDPSSETTPSTPKQYTFAEKLAEELKQIGLEEVSLDENGYLMATLPSNIEKDVPVIGFISHMDTSCDLTGANVKPRIVTNYDGKDITLNQDQNIILKVTDFPEIKNYIGQDIIVTDGTTLLGADDKAGITAIVSAMEYLINHPEIKHGKIRIGFTPDEEIGRGAHKFDVAKFGAQWAYTIDGGEIGELEYENFNAAAATITVTGRNVHPGYAKNKMINSTTIARELADRLPQNEVPEQTTGYEGFFHLMSFNGSIEQTKLVYIIRDHDRELFEDRKKLIETIVNDLNLKYNGAIKLEMKDQYYNMREKVEPIMHIVDLAKEAMIEEGITPKIKPIRGGTDGSQLSYMGLPCPNIFTGGHNFHGRFEYLPINSMLKATDTVKRIIINLAK